MSPLNVQSNRSYKTRPRISSSARSYKEIVYLKYSGATLTTHQAGKHLVCQPVQPLADKISCNCCTSVLVMCMMCGEYFVDCCDDCGVCGGGSGSDSGGGGRKKEKTL